MIVYHNDSYSEPETGVFDTVDEARLYAYGQANRLITDLNIMSIAAGQLVQMTDEVATDFLQEERKRRREGVITPRVTISLNSEYDIDDRYIVLSYVDGKPLQDEYMTSDLLLARQEALTRAAALLDKEAIKAEPSSRVFISDRVWSELVASLPVYVRIDNDIASTTYQVSVMRGGQVEIETPVRDWESAINLATNYAQNRLGYKNPNDVIVISGDTYYRQRQEDARASLPPIRSVSKDEAEIYKKMQQEHRQLVTAQGHLDTHINGLRLLLETTNGMRDMHERRAQHLIISAGSADERLAAEDTLKRLLDDVDRHILEVTRFLAPQIVQTYMIVKDLSGERKEGAE